MRSLVCSALLLLALGHEARAQAKVYSLAPHGTVKIDVPISKPGLVAVRVGQRGLDARIRFGTSSVDFSKDPCAGEEIVVLEGTPPTTIPITIERVDASADPGSVTVDIGPVCGAGCSAEDRTRLTELRTAVDLGLRAVGAKSTEEARPLVAKSDTIFQQQHEWPIAAGLALWWGDALFNSGARDDGFDIMHMALDMCAHKPCEAWVRLYLGERRLLVGSKPKALSDLWAAAAVAENRCPAIEGFAYAEIGKTYSYLGRTTAAKAMFERAAKLPGQRESVLLWLYTFAAEDDRDTQAEAVKFFEKQSGLDPGTVQALGRAYRAVGRCADAVRELSNSNLLTQVFPDVGAKQGYFDLAETEWRCGNRTSGEAHFKTLLKAIDDNSPYEYYLHENVARAYGMLLLGARDYQGAEKQLRLAFGIGVNRLKVNVGHPGLASYLETLDRTSRALAGALLGRCGPKLADCPFAREAFNVIEGTRALGLRTGLAAQNLKYDLDDYSLLVAKRVNELVAELETTSDQVAVLEKEKQLYQFLLWLDDRRGVIMHEGFALSAEASKGTDVLGAEVHRNHLDKLQKELAAEPSTAVVIYALLPNRSFAWVITRDHVQVVPLDGVETIAPIATALWLDLRSARGDAARREDLIRRLSELVVRPLSAKLSKPRKLVIVADGMLRTIPFAPLTTADGKALLAAHDLAYSPSATLVPKREMGVREQRGEGVAIIADPVFEHEDPRLGGRKTHGKDVVTWSRIDDSGAEAAAVASHWPLAKVRRWIGPEATKQSLLAWEPLFRTASGSGGPQAAAPALSRYRILHFATHALADAERPELSRIALSRFDANGAAQVPSLLAFEIRDQLQLSAELVVLSACDTQAGANLNGEGVLSLSRTFIEAGAERVVASLWPLGGKPVVKMMDRMHELLSTGCFDPVHALNQAQREAATALGWKHPELWSQFVLQGRWTDCH